MKKGLIVLFLLVGLFCFGEGEFRTWRALGSFKIEAEFVSYDAGMVRLRKRDGEELEVRMEQLSDRDRKAVFEVAGQHARGALPTGEFVKPKGRRDFVWEPIVRGELWPDEMPDSVRTALTGLNRGWSHAETDYFIVHYQQLRFAREVARMADVQYQYISADLPGFKDRFKEKSHIVVVRNKEDWEEFLAKNESTQAWFAAFVHGKIMYVHDLRSTKQNANMLAHEMSHLVLNRFFVFQPPLWLNEGLAEWYGNFGYSAFEGERVDVGRGLGALRNPVPLNQLTTMMGYPADPQAVARFYQTSQQVVGMLMLYKDHPTFVQFLKAITVDGASFMEPLREVYGIPDLSSLQNLFNEFLNP